MSGTGTSELLLLFVIGLLVLGPERLPKVAREVGRWVGRARREVGRLRQELEREAAHSEVRRRTGEHSPGSGAGREEGEAESTRRGGAGAGAESAVEAQLGAEAQPGPEAVLGRSETRSGPLS